MKAVHKASFKLFKNFITGSRKVVEASFKNDGDNMILRQVCCSQVTGLLISEFHCHGLKILRVFIFLLFILLTHKLGSLLWYF